MSSLGIELGRFALLLTPVAYHALLPAAVLHYLPLKPAGSPVSLR